MLTSLSIRDIVLIDKLDLSLAAGLTVLTGETGAGKSILLDSLGLATGARADRALVRLGQEKGTVTAAFSVTPGHPACALLDEQGMDAGDGEIILRRQITSDGRSRAWANDQPSAKAHSLISVRFLLKCTASMMTAASLMPAHTARSLMPSAVTALISKLWQRLMKPSVRRKRRLLRPNVSSRKRAAMKSFWPTRWTSLNP
nr:AAA family ATPase [Kordiimonas gwangyangensis]